MMNPGMIMIIFLISLAFLLVTIIRFKMNSAIMMMVTAIFFGLAVGIPFQDIMGHVQGGFASFSGSLCLVIGLGAILGNILSESGATDQLAYGLLKAGGSKNANLALNVTGYVTSIPVFMGPAYIVLNPICTTLSKFTRKNVIGYTTALVVGLMVTHCLVIPTPGPLAVSGALQANVGWFIFYSILVSIPASALGGWLYGNWLHKKFATGEEATASDQELLETINSELPKERPSTATALSLILLPLILILLATVIPYLTTSPFVVNLCKFLTTTNGAVSLMISVLVAWFTLRKYITASSNDLFSRALNDVGSIFMIIAASGSFGAVISASGISDILVDFATGIKLPLFVLAFLLSALLKVAMGSSATALVTAAAIMGPMVTSMGANGILPGLAICLGGLFLPIHTDGAFWQVKEFNGLSIKETFYSHTFGNTIACFAGMAIVFILHLGSGFLPGLS